MLRYKQDWRMVAYLLVTTALLGVQWSLPTLNPFLYVWSLFMAVSVSVIAHNHNHLRMWKSKHLNAVTDVWITLFYGFPAFGWIPTHNMNHHKFTNREGDYTITWRFTDRNNLSTVLTYPAVSSYYQQKPIRDYLRTQRETNRARFWMSIAQYVILAAWIAGALLIDWRKALLYVVIPQQTALFAVLVFNYLQHIHADEDSQWNHSRNIVGPLMNILLFNNGFHTVHHLQPGLHWSRLPEAHAAIADNIHPELNERSFWWLLLRSYIVGPFIPSVRTRPLGRAHH